MKSKTLLFLTTALALISFIMACETEDPQQPSVCEEVRYLHREDVAWLPYFSDTGEVKTNGYFSIEEDTFFLVKQTLKFHSTAQDTQEWRVVYVLEDWEAAVEDCPLYQKIRVTLYNSELSQHIDLRMFKDTITGSPELASTKLSVYTCKTGLENSQGVLGGTCPFSTFNLHDQSAASWVEYLPEYTTATATYQDVLLVRNYRSDYELFAYDIYLARGHGVVAYERLDTVWELE